MPPSIQRVAILGVGLIGGSLGLAMRRHAPEIDVLGVDEPDVMDLALRRGAVTRAASSVEDAVCEADLVILAAPLAANLTLMRAAAPHLREGAVVTDVGSVKAAIGEFAESTLPQGALFIGGHPMTGSEKRGVSHADALLFENAVYVLCPPHDLDPADSRMTSLIELIERLGSRLLVIPAARHDEAAASVSHLPQLISIALVNQLAEGDDVAARLAAGGFRDMTRIASSPYGMWRDILRANHGRVLDAMARFARHFERLRNRLAEEDLDSLGDEFHAASEVRAAVPARSKGFIRPLSDVFVYTPDEPGALYRMTGALSDGEVNIKDIELLKIREGTGGTFRLGLDGDREAAHAVELLERAGFQAYQL